MDGLLDAPTLRELVRRNAARDTVMRERFMPRDEDGEPARPSEPPPGVTPRPGAVVALLYLGDDDWYLPLTVRTSAMRNHSGEVSLPGGGFDPADRTLERTALREAWEELGIEPGAVEIVGELTPVWIPVSNFLITPFVGLLGTPPALRPAPSEVAEVIETPLGVLMDPQRVHREMRDIRGRRLHITYFDVAGHKVWGATALVLAQLVGRLGASSP